MKHPTWKRIVQRYSNALYVNIPEEFEQFEKGEKVEIRPTEKGLEILPIDEEEQ